MNLNKKLIDSDFTFPPDLQANLIEELPEKVLQFGEGVFLRGFVDWMFDILIKKNLFNGKIVVVQPKEDGLIDVLNKQNGLYTMLLRGIQGGRETRERAIVNSISRGVNPYTDFEEYLRCAENPHLRFIVSNTTEAGIAYNPNDSFSDAPPLSYPGKLTVFLYKRFTYFKGDVSKGFIFLPCELIDANGSELKRIVLKLASDWNLGDDFISWVNQANYFLNTLVDRIVTGYPKEESDMISKELGYEDMLLNTAEIFHLWVIEGEPKLKDELPFTEAGLNVICTCDMTPYRTRKVRILNGAHTMTVLAAYLCGKDTVKECVEDETIRTFMVRGIKDEIIPTLDMPEKELLEYADSVLERFYNPYIKHYLLNISLNSTSKFKTRVLPSILEYVKRTGNLPKLLSFSMAAYICFYKGMKSPDGGLIGVRDGSHYKIRDESGVLEMFQELWSRYDGSKESTYQLVSKVLGNTGFWDADLNRSEGFVQVVSDYLYMMLTQGMAKAMKNVIGN